MPTEESPPDVEDIDASSAELNIVVCRDEPAPHGVVILFYTSADSGSGVWREADLVVELEEAGRHAPSVPNNEIREEEWPTGDLDAVPAEHLQPKPSPDEPS